LKLSPRYKELNTYSFIRSLHSLYPFTYSVHYHLFTYLHHLVSSVSGTV